MAPILTRTVLALGGLGLLGTTAFGRSLECNKAQTRCLTESTQLTIGDQVGIFNGDGELVATGEVQAMKGERRALLINQRHGTIRKGYNLALMKNDSVESAPTYRIYREPAKITAGGSFGYSTVSVGDGSPATEFSAFGTWRKWNKFQLVGRGTFAAMEGEVTHSSELGYEHLPISMKTVGVLGGAAYVVRQNRPVSFRGELTAGAMYIDAVVDGDPGLVDDSSTNSKVKNGLAPAGRWALGVMWNLGDWHVHGDFAQTLVYQALSNTLAVGVSKDVK